MTCFWEVKEQPPCFWNPICPPREILKCLELYVNLVLRDYFKTACLSSFSAPSKSWSHFHLLEIHLRVDFKHWEQILQEQVCHVPSYKQNPFVSKKLLKMLNTRIYIAITRNNNNISLFPPRDAKQSILSSPPLLLVCRAKSLFG